MYSTIINLFQGTRPDIIFFVVMMYAAYTPNPAPNDSQWSLD
jgi:hypothetical protein